MQVVCGGYADPAGYCSLHYLTNLAARLFEAEVMDETAASGRHPLGELTRGFFRRRGRGTEACLVICRWPGDLKLLLNAPRWRSRFGVTAAWVIDSFLWEAIPRHVKLLRPYDHIFVAGLQDVEPMRRRTGTPTSWLPIGSDALELGSGKGDRPVDVLRIGRQPEEWRDDQVSAAACQRRGLNFHGRPPAAKTPQQNQIAIHQYCADSKFCLAFSNLVAPARHTHPTRVYITPRWADAIASGSTTAGVRPDAPGVDELLWPEATLELNTIERERGLDVLAEAARDWRPEQAERNRLMALKRLDWRWRLDEIARFLNLSPAPLRADLDRLRQTIAEGSAASAGKLDAVG